MVGLFWHGWQKESDTKAKCVIRILMTPLINGNKVFTAMQGIERTIHFDSDRRVIPADLKHLITPDATALDLMIINMRDTINNMELFALAISRSPDISLDVGESMFGIKPLPEDWELQTRELFDTAIK